MRPSKLNHEDRETAWLQFVAGWTLEQIADYHRVHPDTIRRALEDEKAIRRRVAERARRRELESIA